MNPSKTRPSDNIEFHIQIGEYKIILSIPKETKVSELINIVASQESLHQSYGPHEAIFVGLASSDNNVIVDFWVTQANLNFEKFNKSKLYLKAIYSIEKMIDTITINNFEFLKCLGEGACGSVYLVRNRVTGYLFALKRLKKESLKFDQDFKSVCREQKILKNLPNNNHTVKFHASFESIDHFNFVLDYYPGGELFVHLNQGKMLSERDIKRYFCEVLAGIEFLHKNNILYRDLKPENILVDIHGHLAIGDFGLSKCGFREEDNANSHCGSPDYMAPEIIENKDYNFSSDFYGIGAILHEFVTGLPPYYEPSQNGEEDRLEEKLIKMKKMCLRLDEHTKDIHLKELIKGLLNANPDIRISSFKEIKRSPWLADVDWKKVEEKSGELRFAPIPFNSYINQEFLDKQDLVEEMNKLECERFESYDFFDYIRPESEKNLLGRSKTHSKDPVLMKRKPNNITKEKSSKNATKSQIQKGNISIALYEKQHPHKEERGDTASTSNSNASYEPKTTKSINTKENQLFRSDGSKKDLLKKAPSSSKITPNQVSSNSSHNVSECSHRKIGVSRSKPTLLLKPRNNEVLKMKGNLTPANKSKSKEKTQQLSGFQKEKQNSYQSVKKKEVLPVSSYKIKLV